MNASFQLALSLMQLGSHCGHPQRFLREMRAPPHARPSTSPVPPGAFPRTAPAPDDAATATAPALRPFSINQFAVVHARPRGQPALSRGLRHHRRRRLHVSVAVERGGLLPGQCRRQFPIILYVATNLTRQINKYELQQ